MRDPAERKQPPRPLVMGLILAALVVSWGWLMWPASYYWGAESYYNFGWFVPFLTAWFFYRKICEARFEPHEPAGKWRMGMFFAVLAGTVLIVGVARLFGEANFEWRTPLWVHGVALLGLSYIAVGLFSGRRGVAYFAFPFFFLLMALPWTVRLETTIIQSLTRIVTDITVAVVNLIGYPAQAMGNTIRVADMHVGVDEACSGIRSLQALVMIALFFGEFYAFRIWRRLALILGAVALSMAFNGARAIILTLVTVNGTEEKFQFWHDFLGNFNAVICGLLLFGIAELLDWLFTKRSRSRPVLPWYLPRQRQAVTAVAAIAGGFLIAEGAVQGYYTWREAGAETLPSLVIEWPDDETLWHVPEEIPEETAEILAYEYGSQVELMWADGMRATAIHYGYTGQSKQAAIFGFFHSPKICMTGIGAKLDLEKEPAKAAFHGIPWEIEHYEFVFEDGPRREKMQVFWMIWEGRNYTGRATEIFTLRYRQRLQLVLDGRRDYRRQVVLVYVRGSDTRGLVRQRVRDLFDRIVK